MGTQRHAESPGHVLRQPAVVGRVAQTTGLVLTLEEEDLRSGPKQTLNINTSVSHPVRPLLVLVAAGTSRVTYLCPADDFAVGFELWAMEDLDAGDGLHRLAINGTDHTAQLIDTERDSVQLNHTYKVLCGRPSVLLLAVFLQVLNHIIKIIHKADKALFVLVSIFAKTQEQ